MSSSVNYMSSPGQSLTSGKAIALSCVLGSLFAYAAYEAQGFPGQAAYYPSFVAYGGMLSTLVWLFHQLWRLRSSRSETQSTTEAAEPSPSLRARLRRATEGVGVVVLYSAGLLILGYWITSLVLVPLYLVVIARAPLVRSLLIPGGIFGVILVLGQILSFRWPTGVFL